MDPNALILGAIFGFIGQGGRAIIGLKKMIDAGESYKFSPLRLGTTLAIGAIAGALTAALGITDVRALAVAGYAGTDAIEGLLTK